MTFPEELETTMQNSKRNIHDVGKQFKSLMKTARVEGRTTCGVIECAHMLNKNPDDVTLCILPMERHEDVTVHIQHTLIEAFCWENDIVVVKVDSTEKLGMIFSEVNINVNKNNNSNNNNMADDYNCVLITCPSESQTTGVDPFLIDLVSADEHPIIEIPVD